MCTFMLMPGMVSEQRVYLHAEAGDGERAACVPSC